MRRLAYALSAILCLFLGFTQPALAEKRVALVIGNSAYLNVSRLANPRNDAKAMAETLQSLGFTLVGGGVQFDLDKAGFDTVVQTFGNQLMGADVGLFYYAGHGVQLRGTNYLVPVNANPVKETDVDFQMMDVNLVLRQMDGAGAKLKVVVLDACRNNPFGGRGLRSADAGLAQMRAPEGTLISFATQPGNVALDGADGNSPYTKALTQSMRKPGLDVFRVFNEVGLTVSKVTAGAQQPWMSLSPIAGDFYFAGTQETPQLAALPPAPPQQDPAAQAWSVMQNTTSLAVLDDFIRQFGATPYGSMARARRDELKAATDKPVQQEASRSQVADAAPTATLPPLVRRSSENPGFDCSRADLEPIEQMICVDADLARVNSELQRAFDVKRRALSAAARTALIADERDWIKQRDRTCNVPSRGPWTDIDLRTLKTCFIDMSQARTNRLR